MMLASLSEAAKHKTDAAAVGAVASSWIIDHTSLFTGIAAILTVVWFLLRIWESDTVRGLTGRRLPNAGGGDD
jgi:hypothetical protein